MRGHLRLPGVRVLAYSLAGWTLDSLFVWGHTGRRRPSSLLNVPVYGLAQPLFEPVHDRVRRRPLVLRATVYGAGVLGVEYVCGRLLRRFVGRVPWDYGGARFGIDGLVRLDYLPLWAAYGLGLERFHDLLTRRHAVAARRARLPRTARRRVHRQVRSGRGPLARPARAGVRRVDGRGVGLALEALGEPYVLRGFCPSIGESGRPDQSS